MKLGLSDKELLFINKWSRTRAKGKIRFIITRGIIYGCILFLVWLVVTLIEINVSEFQKTLYYEHPSHFVKRGFIWLFWYMVFGLGLSSAAWKGKEEKYKYLS